MRDPDDKLDVPLDSDKSNKSDFADVSAAESYRRTRERRRVEQSIVVLGPVGLLTGYLVYRSGYENTGILLMATAGSIMFFSLARPLLRFLENGTLSMIEAEVGPLSMSVSSRDAKTSDGTPLTKSDLAELYQAIERLDHKQREGGSQSEVEGFPSLPRRGDAYPRELGRFTLRLRAVLDRVRFLLGGEQRAVPKDPNSKEDQIGEDILEAVGLTRDRLTEEAGALSRRVNLNLVIGILTTLAALIILAVLVLQSKSTDRDFSDNLDYYLPRLSLAVFVEIFSFFFLRLYKSGLDDLKYYQNEISNIELWTLGARAAFASKDSRSIATAIEALCRAERNFRLEKGQSTVALEQARLESEALKPPSMAALLKLDRDKDKN